VALAEAVIARTAGRGGVTAAAGCGAGETSLGGVAAIGVVAGELATFSSTGAGLVDRATGDRSCP
jgi:hypothetical protein